MNRVVLVAIAFLLFAEACKGRHTEDDEDYARIRKDLIAGGASPEDIAVLDAIHNTTRPTLVCLCHHDANVTTCGVNGHLYLNECSARCAHVTVACVGEECGDCSQYGPEGILEQTIPAEASVESPFYATPDPEPKAQTKGRRFLTLT